jgi:hypothetical protein
MSKQGKRELELRRMRAQWFKKTVAKPVAAMAEPAAQPQENPMPRAKTKRNNGSSKTKKILSLLQREGGCTRAEALKVSGWPSVSMPAVAKAAGLRLRRSKRKGEPIRYYAG